MIKTIFAKIIYIGPDNLFSDIEENIQCRRGKISLITKDGETYDIFVASEEYHKDRGIYNIREICALPDIAHPQIGDCIVIEYDRLKKYTSGNTPPDLINTTIRYNAGSPTNPKDFKYPTITQQTKGI